MSDLQRLLNMIADYLEGRTDTTTFANHYTVFFSQEVDYDTLKELEYGLFNELEEVTSLFSPFEEDFLLYPYIREVEVRKKAQEVFDVLKNG